MPATTPGHIPVRPLIVDIETRQDVQRQVPAVRAVTAVQKAVAHHQVVLQTLQGHTSKSLGFHQGLGISMGI